MAGAGDGTMISMRCSLRTWAALLLAGIACAMPGCERKGAPGTSGSAPQKDHLRIVSFSPAISRTLVDFGLADRIVGRTPHCDSLNRSIPVVGDLLNVDYEQLIRLAPTHVLVQPPAVGGDSHLLDLAGQHDWKVAQWHLNGREDIEQMVRDIPAVLFADGSAERAAASAKSAELLNRIAEALSPGTKPLFHGRTLMVNAIDPVMVFGRETYLDDVLTALGASNAASSRGWAQLTLEDVIHLNPEAIIIVKPGFGRRSSIDDAAGPLGRLNVAAVANHRIGVLAHADAFTPSTGIIPVADELRTLLQSFAEKSQ